VKTILMRLKMEMKTHLGIGLEDNFVICWQGHCLHFVHILRLLKEAEFKDESSLAFRLWCGYCCLLLTSFPVRTANKRQSEKTWKNCSLVKNAHLWKVGIKEGMVSK
jgi:hypothetical protein